VFTTAQRKKMSDLTFWKKSDVSCAKMSDDLFCHSLTILTKKVYFHLPTFLKTFLVIPLNL